MKSRIETAADFACTFASAGLSRVEDFMSFGGGNIIARSRTTSTIAFEAGGDGKRFFLKRYLFPTVRDRLKGALRGTLLGESKARKEWDNFAFLESIGIGVPERCAWGEARVRGFVRGCFIVTGEIQGATRADNLLAGGFDGDLCMRLGMAVAAMHSNAYKDGSLALRNFLVSGPQGRVFKVDCPKGRIGQGIRTRDRVRDLGPLLAGILLVCGKRGVLPFFGGYFRAAGRELNHAQEDLVRRAEARAALLRPQEQIRLAEAGIGYFEKI